MSLKAQNPPLKSFQILYIAPPKCVLFSYWEEWSEDEDWVWTWRLKMNIRCAVPWTLMLLQKSERFPDAVTFSREKE